MPKIERTCREKEAISFSAPEMQMLPADAERCAREAMHRWTSESKEEGARIRDIMTKEFPDSYKHDAYWKEGGPEGFKDFFTWGHDHTFAEGVVRNGAMGERHIEIVSECLSAGFLQRDLSNQRLLDIGCWSGGDLLLLSALGANVQAIEEHQVSARAAIRLCELLGCETSISSESPYKDDESLQGSFDVIYASGVIYHVTDPLLFARIAFAYLKPGGRLILETKAQHGEGAICSYSGTAEFGWNWYAPTRTTLGRWMIDAGFDAPKVELLGRTNGRLLSCAVKTEARQMSEVAGFSRPGSWLEGKV